MEKPLDLRIQKTHKALVEAFLSLLKEKRFENITVNEICDTAMVRRATFYKHFGDKYELFTFMLQYIRREFQDRSSTSESHRDTPDPYVLIVKDTLDFLDENEALVQSVMNSSAFSVLMDLFSAQVTMEVKRHLLEAEKNGEKLPFVPELLALAFTGMLSSIGRWWIQHKDEVTKEEVTGQIQKMIEKLYYAPEATA